MKGGTDVCDSLREVQLFLVDILEEEAVREIPI